MLNTAKRWLRKATVNLGGLVAMPVAAVAVATAAVVLVVVMAVFMLASAAYSIQPKKGSQ